MGIAVSKKHGKAVTRNRIKRLVRSAFADSCERLERNYSIIVLPRIADEYSYDKMKDGFYICFKKVNSCEKS